MAPDSSSTAASGGIGTWGWKAALNTLAVRFGDRLPI